MPQEKVRRIVRISALHDYIALGKAEKSLLLPCPSRSAVGKCANQHGWAANIVRSDTCKQSNKGNGHLGGGGGAGRGGIWCVAVGKRWEGRAVRAYAAGSRASRGRP